MHNNNLSIPSSIDEKESNKPVPASPLHYKSESSSSPPLQDSIYLANPFTDRQAPDVVRYLVFVIPGNPGLIEYYRPFITRLYGTLQDRDFGEGKEKRRVVWEVCGRSMGGFELEDQNGKEVVSEDPKVKSGLKRFVKAPWKRSSKVYGLQEQIVFMERRLREVVKGQKNVKVILVGHSVGAYIALELIRRHRERLETLRSPNRTSSWRDDEPDIISGICLFPTLMQIRASQKGKQFVAIQRCVGGSALMPHLLSTLLKIIVLVLPAMVITGLVRKVGKLSGRAEETTVGWIRSKNGVLQGLHVLPFLPIL
jgi:Lipid-droplet associated hydrolase